MIEIIKSLDSSLLEVEALKEYLQKFEKYEILNQTLESDNGEINILYDNESIKLIFINISNGKWWSIYRYHSDGTKYEQIDIMTYEKAKERGHNRVIKYSGHIENICRSYIVCSAYTYLGSKFIGGWKETRIIPIQDLTEIQYCNDMNLTELVFMADKKSNSVISKNSSDNEKTMVLKL